MLTPKVKATVVPILQVGKVWLREINMPREAEAESEASPVRLQRQSLEPLSGHGEDGTELCHLQNDPGWHEESGATAPISSVTAEIPLGHEEVPISPQAHLDFSTLQDSFL